jgi:hypothetical protein
MFFSFSADRDRSSHARRERVAGRPRSSPSARAIVQAGMPRIDPFACKQASGSPRARSQKSAPHISWSVDGLLRKWPRRENVVDFYFQQGANPSIASFDSSSLRSRFALSAPSGFLLSNPCCAAALRAASKSPDANAETIFASIRDS